MGSYLSIDGVLPDAMQYFVPLLRKWAVEQDQGTNSSVHYQQMRVSSLIEGLNRTLAGQLEDSADVRSQVRILEEKLKNMEQNMRQRNELDTSGPDIPDVLNSVEEIMKKSLGVADKNLAADKCPPSAPSLRYAMSSGYPANESHSFQSITAHCGPAPSHYPTYSPTEGYNPSYPYTPQFYPPVFSPNHNSQPPHYPMPNRRADQSYQPPHRFTSSNDRPRDTQPHQHEPTKSDFKYTKKMLNTSASTSVNKGKSVKKKDLILPDVHAYKEVKGLKSDNPAIDDLVKKFRESLSDDSQKLKRADKLILHEKPKTGEVNRNGKIQRNTQKAEGNKKFANRGQKYNFAYNRRQRRNNGATESVDGCKSDSSVRFVASNLSTATTASNASASSNKNRKFFWTSHPEYAQLFNYNRAVEKIDQIHKKTNAERIPNEVPSCCTEMVRENVNRCDGVDEVGFSSEAKSQSGMNGRNRENADDDTANENNTETDLCPDINRNARKSEPSKGSDKSDVAFEIPCEEEARNLGLDLQRTFNQCVMIIGYPESANNPDTLFPKNLAELYEFKRRYRKTQVVGL